MDFKGWSFMGIYDRDYYQENNGLSHRVGTGPLSVCKWIVFANVFVFILQILTRSEGPWGVTDIFILDGARVLQGEVWRLLTYGFLHSIDNPMHILMNMLLLWWFGKELEDTLQSWEFTWFYLGSIVFGGLVFILGSMVGLHGKQALCLGASGGVSAILILFACWFPMRTVLFMFVIPMPVWLLAVIVVTLDSLNLISGSHGEVAGEVHLAGAGFALVYFYSGWKFSNWSIRRAWKKMNAPKLRLYTQNTMDEPRKNAPVENDGENVEKLDNILRKISLGGKGSLTQEENEYLVRVSEIMKRKKQ